jgi:hypothetical protein
LHHLEALTLTHILLGKLKIIGRNTDQSFRIRVMPQEIRYPSQWNISARARLAVSSAEKGKSWSS